MSADKHTFPIAIDDSGNVFINRRLCYSPSTGVIEGEAEKVGARWFRKDPDEWFSIGVPSLVASPGDSDTLKLSGLRKTRVYALNVDGREASEDAVDANHCEDWELYVEDLWAAKRYCATIKGGSKRFKVVVARQHGHGGETDWDFGNFSDQGNSRTTGGCLQVSTVDGSKVRVRYLTSDEMKLEPGSQGFEITRMNQGWFYPVFNFLKDLYSSIARLFR